MRLVLRNARLWRRGPVQDADLAVEGPTVAAVGPPGSLLGDRVADLQGRLLLPGLVNAHDHLDFSTFPPLGDPPYANVYDWAAAVDGGRGDPRVGVALAVPLADRLFLGGVRNLLAGVTAVAHHNPYHRSLGRRDFPVRVLSRYGFAHSPGVTPHLRRTYRTTDRRIPWMVHAGEGTDLRAAAELQLLREANVLRQNTVIIHGIALRAEEAMTVSEARACVVWCPESNRVLYGATAPVRELRAAGVRVGLGSDSPASGVRDALSNLAAARREAVLPDSELLSMATQGSAEVARLPVGGLEAGAPADLLAVDDLEPLLAGRRTAVALVMVAGRARFGRLELMESLGGGTRLEVDGEERLLERDLGRRLCGLLKGRAGPPGVLWTAGLSAG